MGTMLESWSVAFLAAGEGTEQAELPKPREAVLAQGGRPVLVAPRGGQDPDVRAPRPRRHHGRERAPRRREGTGLRRPGTAGRGGQPPISCVLPRRLSPSLRASTTRASRRLPSASVMAAHRGRCSPWPDAHLVAQPADRHQERGRDVGRQGGRSLRKRPEHPRDEPQAAGPAGLLRSVFRVRAVSPSARPGLSCPAVSWRMPRPAC